MRHAGVVTAAPSELRVDYNCHRAGIGLLAVSVPLPGHTTVMLRWSKRCSALPMTGISIGTSTSTLTDVVLEGAVAPAYNASTVRAAMGTLTRRAVFVVTASLLGGSQVCRVRAARGLGSSNRVRSAWAPSARSWSLRWRSLPCTARSRLGSHCGRGSERSWWFMCSALRQGRA